MADSADARNSDDTFNILDYRRENGGDPDLASPTATVTSPRDGKQYAVGDAVSTSFTAGDDVGIDRVTASLDVNGDGTVDDSETVTAVAGAGGTYTATLPALSGPFGTRDLVVTVYDLSGNTGGTSRTIGVGAVADNDPPEVSLSPIGTVHEASTVQVSASATDPENDPITYSWSATGATITGSGATASLSVGDGPATATVTVTATDDHGHAATASQEVTVVNVAPSGVFGNDGPGSEGADFHLSLTSPTDPSSGDTAAGFSFAFDCGHGYGVFGGAASARCGTADNGTLSVGAEIRDRDGGVREYRSSVTVANLPPAVFGGSPQTQFWGLPVMFVGAAADPSSVDQAAGFATRWNFGDRTPDATSATAVHVYTTPGSYTATFKATDKDGATGTATVAVTVGKRGTTVAYTGSSGTTPYGYATLSARLADALDPASGDLANRRVTFTVGVQTYAATTDASGVASVALASPLAPGTYSVTTRFLGDTAYNLSSVPAVSLKVASSVGTVTGAGLVSASNGARASFSVSSSDGVTVRGSLSYTGGGTTVAPSALTPLGIASDGHSAWFAGVSVTGQQLRVYVEDRGPGPANDRFQLWVNGVLQNGTGLLSAGEVTISRP